MTSSRDPNTLAAKALTLLRQAELLPGDPGAILPRQVGALSLLAELLPEAVLTPHGLDQAANQLDHIEAWLDRQLADRYATIDLAAVLESRRQIAHIWGVEDVAEVRPDLTGEQAWEVLQYAERKLDSDLSISWDTLEIVAGDMFPESTNTSEKFHGN